MLQKYAISSAGEFLQTILKVCNDTESNDLPDSSIF